MARGRRATASEAGPVGEPWVLPDGWRWERLSDRAELLRGVTYTKGQASSTRSPLRKPLLRGNNIQRGVIDLMDLIYVDTSCISPDQVLRPGDVVLTMSSGSAALVGKSAFVKSMPQPTTFGAFCGCIRATKEIDATWIYWFAQTDHYRRLISASAQGTNINNLKRQDLQGLAIPFPPLDTQRRTVARIDELFVELDNGETALTRAKSDLETYRKSLLQAAVTGELTADWRADNPAEETGEQLLERILAERRARWEAEPKNRGKRYKEPSRPPVEKLPAVPDNWAWATLPMLGDFGRGKSKHRPRNDPMLYGGSIPFVQTGVVANCGGRITHFEQTYSQLGLDQSKLWPKGTLCITIAANIAKSGVLDFPACFPDSIVGLSCLPGIGAEFVELVMQSVQEDLERYAPATAQKNINLEVLEQVAIPLPPVSEQSELVRATTEMLDAAEDLVRGELESEISQLRQSILAAAFRGELVQ